MRKRDADVVSARASRVDPARMFASRLVVFGPLIAIAGGRWGSYLGIAGTPIYFADLSVGLGVALLACNGMKRTDSGRWVKPERMNGGLLVGAVCVGALLLVGFWGSLSRPAAGIVTIRDSLPFVYMLLIPVFVSAIQYVGADQAIRWLRTATILHTVWFVPAVVGLLGEVTIPVVAGAPVFGTRGDFDALVCGLAVVLLLVGQKNMDARVSLTLVLLNLAAMPLSGSRAGLIAAVIIIVLVTITRRPFRDRARGPVRLGVTCLITAPLLLAGIALVDSPPAWALGLQKLLPNDSATYQSAQNTAAARTQAWQLIRDFVSDQDATWLGLGFGSEPIRDSGAVRYLSGDVTVRAAHSFAVTWYAVVGMVGLALLVVALFAWARLAWRNVREAQVPALIGTGLVASLLAAGLVGVILESPFGYTTFALAVALAVAGSSATKGQRDDSAAPASASERLRSSVYSARCSDA